MSAVQVTEADVVVLPGGPGGSTLATLVAMRGHRVILLEKEKFPRFQIGESLLPSTIHGVCQLTGVAGELHKAGFTKKRGRTLRWGANPEPWTFSFSVSPKMTGETSHAYQVERSKFDQILLDHARHMGVDVREEHAVTDVIEDEGGRVCGVSYTDAEGNEGTVRARWVVDASGNKSRIYQRAGTTRQYSEFFRSLALFGYRSSIVKHAMQEGAREQARVLLGADIAAAETRSSKAAWSPRRTAWAGQRRPDGADSPGARMDFKVMAGPAAMTLISFGAGGPRPRGWPGLPP
jgi:flavin-dependent dehydrogenase